MVLGFPPTSCAISNLAAPCPGAPRGQPRVPGPVEFGGAKGQVAFSLCLPWSSLLSGWCCPPLPHVFGVRLSVFLWFFYIEAPGPAPTPIPALRLIYLSLRTRLLCFQPLLLPYS